VQTWITTGGTDVTQNSSLVVDPVITDQSADSMPWIVALLMVALIVVAFIVFIVVFIVFVYRRR